MIYLQPDACSPIMVTVDISQCFVSVLIQTQIQDITSCKDIMYFIMKQIFIRDIKLGASHFKNS